MMDEWSTYPKNRKIKKKEQHVVVVPGKFEENSVNCMPLFCDVCEFRYSTQEDEHSFKIFNCCSACADTWAYSNREKWKDGWRPSAEQVQFLVEKRVFINNFIQFE